VKVAAYMNSRFSSLKRNIDPQPLEAFVVDDEPRMRIFVSHALRNFGFNTFEMSSVAEVEAILTLRKPEVILLDLSLGPSDAVEIMRSLVEARFSGKILLMSGQYADTLQEVETIGKRYGLAMLPFLQKPFRVEELRRRLAGITRSDSAMDARSLLEYALDNNWLELWYQPKIDLKTMLLCGAEALIRVHHPQRGILLPGEFLPAPGDPLYKPLTDFVVRRALADWPSFAANGILLRPAINVPASLLQTPAFVDNVRRHLPKSSKFPGLIVEITETEAIADPELAREVAVQLKLHNILLAIDDFGTDYSTLARLNEVPFTELKLDRKFVAGCALDPQKFAMCQNVIALAHAHFKTVAVAEGVDNQADLKALIGLGFDVAQGFLFAKPMPRGDFAKLLQSRATCGQISRDAATL
jgi:EAL domain-containing protein (putative c-di-GMP-specific phosphodiesterase class I)/ActR/RegA family two-component response regulator